MEQVDQLYSAIAASEDECVPYPRIPCTSAGKHPTGPGMSWPEQQ